MSEGRPRKAMVLAAGLGTRMRQFSAAIPKALVPVAGKPLIDHVLDRLEAAKVDIAVVNVHHFADKIEQHVATRAKPTIIISDERDALLDTGGGIARALPHFEGQPFFHVNSDTIWIEGPTPNLDRLAMRYDRGDMDALLLLAPTVSSVGYSGRGDYAMDANGRLRRRLASEIVPFVYAGVAIFSPALFADAPSGAFSLNLLFDVAQDNDRLFGLRLEGTWMHVGTPEAIEAAEAALAERVA